MVVDEFVVGTLCPKFRGGPRRREQGRADHDGSDGRSTLRCARGLCVAKWFRRAYAKADVRISVRDSKGANELYDPRGALKDFRLQAHPEACVGTQESFETLGRQTARMANADSAAGHLQLTPEDVPAGTPPGWRGFRFTDSERVLLGTVCGVVYDRETGSTVFVMSDTSPQTHSGLANFATRQSGATAQESHILVPPNGYVSPELVVGNTSADSEG